MHLAPSDALQQIPPALREELLAEFDKIVRNYRERRWEPAELNGGKYCEVVYTIVRGFLENSFPPSASKPKNFVDACRALENVGASTAPHSLRILIPRLLPGLYDIRNNRGVGHVGGDVDPNHMDSTLVLHMARWILAELVRVFHSITVDDAHRVIEGLVDRIVPAIWELPDGRMRVLNLSLTMRQRMLIVLYQSHPQAVVEADLVQAIGHSNASVFRRDVLRRAHKNATVDYDEVTRIVRISPLGIREVEEQIDLEI